MSNAYLQQFFFSHNHQPVYLEANCVIDSGQSPNKTRNLKGSGTKSIVHVATGTYQINLSGGYNRYLGGAWGFVSGITGTVGSGSLSVGTLYVIEVVGTTNWQTAGVPKGVVPMVGTAFVATATSAGTGVAGTPVDSGIYTIEVAGDPNATVTNYTNPYFIIRTLNASGAPTDPLDGSVMGLTTFLRNSSVKGKGE